jgi:hypothetical protein
MPDPKLDPVRGSGNGIDRSGRGFADLSLMPSYGTELILENLLIHSAFWRHWSDRWRTVHKN